MKIILCFLFTILTANLYAQYTRVPMYRIPEEKIRDYATGNIYLADGSVKNGFIEYGYTYASKVKFKETLEQKKPKKYKSSELIGFTIEKDTFCVLSNFKSESRYAFNAYDEKTNGIAKVLIEGDVSLLKYYNFIDVTTPFDNYILARKEGNFSDLHTVRTANKKAFAENTSLFFKDYPELSNSISMGEVSFLDLIDIVNNYNSWKSKNETNR